MRRKRSPLAEDADSTPQAQHHCAVAMCPLPGSISLDTHGAGPWFCRFHVMAGGIDWPSITEDVKRALAAGEIDRTGRPIKGAKGASA